VSDNKLLFSLECSNVHSMVSLLTLVGTVSLLLNAILRLSSTGAQNYVMFKTISKTRI